jgi:type III pantothenate kinase
MIIVLDVGNSRFKWSTLSNAVLSSVHSQEHRRQDKAQAIVTALESSQTPRRIVVASVLGDDFKAVFTRFARARLGAEPEFVVPERFAYGVLLAYTDPSLFGADRFAALVAARQDLGQACILVDCGTAVTIDALTSDGEHLGGLILPGPDLMRRSLIEHTARLDDGDDRHDYSLFGRSTSHAVKVGALRGLAGAIDRIVEDMSISLSERDQDEIQRIMTGGAGAVLLPYLTANYRLEPQLVLQGLAIIAQGNRA